MNNFAPMHLIQNGKVKFLVFPAPTNDNYCDYAVNLNSKNVKDIVHLIELNYDTKVYAHLGFTFYNLSFADGGTPSTEQLQTWYNLLDQFFSSPLPEQKPNNKYELSINKKENNFPNPV